MADLHVLISWVVGILGIAGSIVGGFTWVEGVASGDFKRAVTEWLRRSNLESLSWPDHFLVIFDRVFGTRLFTWKTFLRCTIASLVLCAALTFLWYALRPESFAGYVDYIGNCRAPLRVDDPHCSPRAYIWLPLFFLLFNVPGDFLGLIVSRKIMGAMLRMKNRVAWLVASVAGTLACLLVYFLVSVLTTAVLALILVKWDLLSLDQLARLWEGAWNHKVLLGFGFGYDATYNPEWPTLGVFIYTSMFTVAWMWLFLASGWLVRLLSWIDPGWQKFKWLLDIDGHPLKSLGVVAGVIYAVSFSLVKLVVA